MIKKDLRKITLLQNFCKRNLNTDNILIYFSFYKYSFIISFYNILFRLFESDNHKTIKDLSLISVCIFLLKLFIMYTIYVKKCVICFR